MLLSVVISAFCGFLSTLNLSGITSKFDIINMFIIFDAQKYLIWNFYTYSEYL